MLWSFQKQSKRVDAVLTEYFENIQILGDIKEQKVAEQELLELRAWKDKMSIESSPDEQTENLPPPPQANRES